MKAKAYFFVCDFFYCWVLFFWFSFFLNFEKKKTNVVRYLRFVQSNRIFLILYT